MRLSHRYIPARQLPDKAVSLLDTACARVAISQHAAPAGGRGLPPAHRGAARPSWRSSGARSAIGIDDRRTRRAVGARRRWRREAERRWRSSERAGRPRRRWSDRDARTARRRCEGEGADAARTPGRQCCAELAPLQAELAALQGEAPLILPSVDEQAVAAVVQDWTGIPVGRMVKNEIETVLEAGRARWTSASSARTTRWR